MKIGFFGKGGVGKTTLSTLFSLYASKQGNTVWHIDCDVNQGSATRFGLQKQTVTPLQDEYDYLRKTLSHQNPRLLDWSLVQKTTPPGRGSLLLEPSLVKDTPVINKCGFKVNDNLYLFRSGTVNDSQVGHKCHHYSVGSVELLVTHTIDKDSDILVFDMMAGSDIFSTPLFSYLDLLVIIVTPSMYAVDVLEEFKARSTEYDLSLAVIGNQVFDQNDSDFIGKHSGTGVPTLGFFSHNSTVRNLEKHSDHDKLMDQSTLLIDADQNIKKVFQNIINRAKSPGLTRKKLREHVIMFHKINADSWANASAGVQLKDQIDFEFRFPDEE